jgi:diguanylate cyclase (GGDEF)-like protein
VEILDLNGITAAAATSATAAINAERELHPSVVVCDQRLPDMSGLDLCAAIRAIDPDVSLILLTGHATLDTAIAAVGQIDQYLTKPAPPDELVRCVIAGTERAENRRAERLAAAELRRTLEEQLRRQALHDALTDLPNRTLFVERAQHALDQRGTKPLAVCFLDLDDFKDVNDTYGHHAGDDLLCVVALRLVECVRPADTVARFGGDEFAILLEDTDLEAAVGVVQRIHRAVSAPIRLTDAEVIVHASVGIAPSVDRHPTPEVLLAEADAAMYAAKRRGSQGFEVFDPAMRVASEQRSRTRIDIDDALRRSEFRLHYQPIVQLRTGDHLGHEALIRWHHPERGTLAPAEFIEQAEASGQIVPIGEWVLRTATDAFARQPGAPAVSVNISARQLQQRELVEDVATVLQATGLPPQRLILEITETATVIDIDRAMAQLNDLKALGLELALDDFGTGYSSLSYLRRFPVDYLKIDRSFVCSLASSSEDRAIVRGVIDIAHALGLLAIAEGIENATQRDILAGLGCDLGQGYFWTEPVPLEHLPPCQAPSMPSR